MKVVLQRVLSARVEINNRVAGQIAEGYLLLVGIGRDDSTTEVEYMAQKVLKLRLFGDSESFMKRNITQEQGALLVVSQFTLYGNTKKGTRPSFSDAAAPEHAKLLYDHFVATLKDSGLHVETGEFQEHMQVYSVNDGPITLLLEGE